MITELHDLIDVCDATGNKKGKKILLIIAGLPESKQPAMLALTKILVDAGK